MNFLKRKRELVLKERTIKKDTADYVNMENNLKRKLQTVNVENQKYGIFSNGKI
jgi:hypothetical protein